jgi:hypothetical protein
MHQYGIVFLGFMGFSDEWSFWRFFQQLRDVPE